MADDDGYVSDPDILAQLNAPERESSASGYVSDPDLLAQLNTPDQASNAPSNAGYVSDPDLLAELNAPEQRTEREGIVPANVREFAHGVVPTLGGIAGGVAAGAAYGAAFGPPGIIAGMGAGLVGGLGAGYLFDRVQQSVLSKFGFDDEAQRAANREAYPKSTTISGLAPAVLALSPGGFGKDVAQNVISRVLTGGAMGGVDIAQQAVTKGEVDPFEAAASFGAGALLNKPTKYIGEPLIGAAEKVGAGAGGLLGRKPPAAATETPSAPATPEEVATQEGEPMNPPGKPSERDTPEAAAAKAEVKAQTPVDTTQGVAPEQAPPKKIKSIGDQQNGGEGSEQNYPKSETEEPVTTGQPETQWTSGEDLVAAALRLSQKNARPSEPRDPVAPPAEQKPAATEAPTAATAEGPVSKEHLTPQESDAAIDRAVARALEKPVQEPQEPSNGIPDFLKVANREPPPAETALSKPAETVTPPKATRPPGVTQGVWEARQKVAATEEAAGTPKLKIGEKIKLSKEQAAIRKGLKDGTLRWDDMQNKAVPVEAAPRKPPPGIEVSGGTEAPKKGIRAALKRLGPDTEGGVSVPSSFVKRSPESSEPEVIAPKQLASGEQMSPEAARARLQELDNQQRTLMQLRPMVPTLIKLGVTPEQMQKMNAKDAYQFIKERSPQGWGKVDRDADRVVSDAIDNLRAQRSAVARFLSDEEGAFNLAQYQAGVGKLKAAVAANGLVRSLRAIFAPRAISAAAERAQTILRRTQGHAERLSQASRAILKPFHEEVNKMTPLDQRSFLDYMEGGNAFLAGNITPELRNFATGLRQVFTAMENNIRSVPSLAQMHFIQDFMPHMYEDRAGAAKVVANVGAGKTGSGSSTKKRVFADYEEALAKAGFHPKYDPLETGLRYIDSMGKFVALKDTLHAGEQEGDIIWTRPKSVGASGGTTTVKPPEGWVRLQGPHTTGPFGDAYAPEDWARVYNNFYGKGFHSDPTRGAVYDSLRNTSNFLTALSLFGGGFHSFAMAQEGTISAVARGFSELASGDIKGGLTSIGKAPTAPYKLYELGKFGQDLYTGMKTGTAQQQESVALMEAINFKPIGRQHAADYTTSAEGSYWTQYKQGGLEKYFASEMQKIGVKPTYALTFAAKQAGRVMQTAMAPLFEHYIPALKTGAFMDNMGGWLGKNPNATWEQKVAQATKIGDSIDNRLGEMAHDNLFWNRTQQQTAQLAFFSYSWTLGTIREIGGGAQALVAGALQGQNRMSYSSPHYDPRTAYLPAAALVIGTTAAVYQYLKSGKSPESWRDLLAPRTGGHVAGTGGKGIVEERASLPGYQKDVMGWSHDPGQELYNKLTPLIHTAADMYSTLGGKPGKDWRDKPIVRPNATAMEATEDRLKHVAKMMVPITAQQLIKGDKQGSNIGTIGKLFGQRPASMRLTDPEGSERAMNAINQRNWKSKERLEQRERRNLQ